MRRQLLALVAATTSLVLLAFLVPLALLLRSDAEDRGMAAATLEAQSLASIVGSVDSGQVMVALDQINADHDRQVSVFMPDGTVLGAPARRGAAVQLAQHGQAFSTTSMRMPDGGRGRAILVPVQGLPGGTAVVQAVVPERVLRRGVTRAWVIIGLLALVLLGLGLAVADALGRRLVRSVGELAAVSDTLARGDLTARVRPDGPPEVRTVGAGLNRLAVRIGELLTAVREEVADVSHRLRTPVTALKLDVDSLRDPEEAERMRADVDLLERMVDEVIRSARRPEREGVGASGDLAAVVAERTAFWSALAEDQGRRLDTALPERAVTVRATRQDLEAVVDALLGNVFAHTPEGVGLRVDAGPRPGGGGLLTVEDAGPGFPDGEVMRRGHSGGGSTGLGLDIVRRTAEVSGGAVRLSGAASGGARVVVEFGPPA